MSVRIFFRGLVLFSIPETGDDEGKIVAKLITRPAPGPSGGGSSVGGTPASGGPSAGGMHAGHTGPAQIGGSPARGPHDHTAEIQIVNGAEIKEMISSPLRDRRTEITVLGGEPRTRRSQSFRNHVPKLSTLASRAGLTRGDPDNSYVSHTITIDRGVLRVKDVVTWDEGGYPLPTHVAGQPDWVRAGFGELPTTPAMLKFAGCEMQGHMANECVVEIPDATAVDVSTGPGEHHRYKALHQLNQRTALDTVDIRYTNYPIQRAKPVPWGLDFQWLMIAAGYGTVDMAAEPNFREFLDFATQYDAGLLREDLEALLPAPRGRPFPYIVPTEPLITLKPLTALDSRPVCVPGDE